MNQHMILTHIFNIIIIIAARCKLQRGDLF